MIDINFKAFFKMIWEFIKGLFTKPKPTPPDPPEPKPITVKICLPCDKLASPGCAISAIEKITFIEGDQPTEYCEPSKCCKILPPPPPPINKLIKEKQYKNAGKLVCPVLIPSYGFNLKTTDKDAEDFADRIAREGWGNFMRLFVAGNWEAFYQKEAVINFPYNHAWSMGKKVFDLDITNPVHFDSLFRRAGYLAERGIMPMFTLLDNCSIHIGAGKRNGFWDTHWMNGDNNVNGTSNEAYSQTHWYEYNKPPSEREGMFETGKHLLDLYYYVLRKATEHFGDFFLVEIGNEIDARNKYHQMIREVVDESLLYPTAGRVFTSMKHDHFYESRQVYQHCIPVLHNCADFMNYLVMREHVPSGKQHGASQDGTPPMVTVKETKEEVLKILREGSIMYEGNLRPLFVKEGGSWKNLIREGRYREIDHSLRTLPFDHMRAYGQAMEDYLG